MDISDTPGFVADPGGSDRNYGTPALSTEGKIFLVPWRRMLWASSNRDARGAYGKSRRDVTNGRSAREVRSIVRSVARARRRRSVVNTIVL